MELTWVDHRLSSSLTAAVWLPLLLALSFLRKTRCVSMSFLELYTSMYPYVTLIQRWWNFVHITMAAESLNLALSIQLLWIAAFLHASCIMTLAQLFVRHSFTRPFLELYNSMHPFVVFIWRWWNFVNVNMADDLNLVLPIQFLWKACMLALWLLHSCLYDLHSQGHS